MRENASSVKVGRIAMLLIPNKPVSPADPVTIQMVCIQIHLLNQLNMKLIIYIQDI